MSPSPCSGSGCQGYPCASGSTGSRTRPPPASTTSPRKCEAPCFVVGLPSAKACMPPRKRACVPSQSPCVAGTPWLRRAWVPVRRPCAGVGPLVAYREGRAPCPLPRTPCLSRPTRTRAPSGARTLHACVHPGGRAHTRAHTHARAYAVPPARHGRWAFGIPVPMALMLTADGHTEAHAEGTGWKVNVEVVAPLAGLLVKYQGDVYDAS